MKPTGDLTPGRVRWWNRISLRVSLWIVALLVATGFAAPRIMDAIHKVTWNPTPGFRSMVVAAKWGIYIAIDAEEQSPGQWKLDKDAANNVAAELAKQGAGFAWIDVESRILAASAGLLRVGADWSPVEEYGSHRGLVKTLQGEEIKYSRIAMLDGVMNIGSFAVISRVAVEPPPVAPDAVPVVMPEIPREMQGGVYDTMKNRSRTEFWVASILCFVVAFLLALLVSFFVTRRIVRLTRLAKLPILSADGDGRSVRVGGKDEIALVASIMQQQRAKIGELVGDIEKRDELRKTFVSQIEHDLRTPLTSLQICLDRVSESGEQNEGVSTHLQNAQFDIHRIRELCDDLNKLSELDLTTGLQFDKVMPEELIGRAVRCVTPSFDARGLEITVSVDSALPTIEADGQRLLRALENLLHNAGRHAKSSVSVTASLTPKGHLRFEVVDDGTGFAASAVNFEELHKTAQGSGLGLQITRSVVAAHHGQVFAHNREGGGACIGWTMPVERQDAA